MKYLDEMEAAEYGSGRTGGIYEESEATSNGVTYVHVIVGRTGCQGDATAWVDYSLGRAWSRSSTTVGLRDDAPVEATQVSLNLYADGTQIARGSVSLGTATPVDVSVSGVLRLRLEIVDPRGPEVMCGFAKQAKAVFANPLLRH